MTEKVKRSYNCKDEELLIICALVLLSFKRDLSVFTGYTDHRTTVWHFGWTDYPD